MLYTALHCILYRSSHQKHNITVSLPTQSDDGEDSGETRRRTNYSNMFGCGLTQVVAIQTSR